MKKRKLIFILFFSLIANNILLANTPTTVSTFEAISIYWSPESGSKNLKVLVNFRKEGSSAWQEGLSMKYSPIGRTLKDIAAYRGSIVNLNSNTNYEIKLTLEGSSTSETITAKTWSEDYPISDTITLGDRTIPYSVYDSGTPDGYRLIDGTGATIDVKDNSEQCLNVRGSYVIIRGFTLKNAQRHGIKLINCHNVIIEDCDISGWGEKNSDGFGVNYQSGIYSESTTIKRIVIQRCRIHHPRYDANSWAEKNEGGYHPSGPQGISFINSDGNNVIRYNEIWSDKDHMFNDVIGGGTNGSHRGFPGPDSDIYSNYIANCWDDGIEAEGGNRNTRIWGNFIEETFLPIANAATSIGPLYIWKNTSGRCYGPPGSYYGVHAPFIKMGYAGSINWMTGHMYVFNNTILQPNGEGAGGVGMSDNSNRYIKHCKTRNNILHVHSSTTNAISIRSENTDNDFDYDLLSSKYPSNSEANGIKGIPTYVDGANFDRTTMTANYFLNSRSNGYDAGEIIPNFTDNYHGAAPDIGAFEAGDAPTKYGVKAYVITGLDENKTSVINNFKLFQNYPNPFNPSTSIEYQIQENGFVNLIVYNSLAQIVAKLVNEVQPVGKYSIIFNGSKFSSGLYFYKLQINNQVRVKKMILLK